MKKFVLLIALLLGAPTFAVADTLGGLGGLFTGVGLGSLVGGGNGKVLAQVVLGVGLADAGSRIEDRTYGARNRPQVETIYVTQGSYGEDLYSQGGYVRGRPPQCYDQGSGGSTDCDEYYRRDRSRNVSYPRRAQTQPARRATYDTSQEAPRTQNMFERPEMRQPVAEKVAVQTRESRLTVDNYMNVDSNGNTAVPKKCQKKNWGVASVCVKAWSGELKALQRRCEKGEDNPDCENNPGAVSKDAADLSEALKKKQEESQGGPYVDN